MPAYSQTSVGSLPDIDEATAPFSSLFDNNFDRATVEATVPLADRAIFVAPNGRRFKFESIPDGAGVGGDQSDGRGSRYSQSQSPVANSLLASQAAPTRDHRAPSNASSIRRRPVSGLSAGLQHHASGRGAPEAMRSPGPADPRDAAEDLTPMMAQLNVHRFSATPFFADSDGGVLAAETLTDPDPSPRLPIPPSPTSRSATALSPTVMNRLPNYQGSSYTPQPYLGGRYPSQPPLMTTAVAVDHNYGYQSPPPSDSQYQSIRHTSLPSLVGESSPVPHSPRTNAMVIPPPDSYQHTGYYQPSSQSHFNANYGSPPRNASSPAISYLSGLQHDDDRRRSEGSSFYGPVGSPPAPTNRVYNIPTGESHYDTQTPVVVIPGSRPQSRPHQGSTSSRSDGASTGRDNVLPGEDVLFDGPVKIAQTLSSPFLAATLKVFRNTLSNDLRFHWKIGYDSETYWMKGSTAQLIPVYAYDQRFPNVLYIRDNDVDRRSVHNGGATSPNPGNAPCPGGFYQFSRLQEVCNFQAKLTGEKVVLDISSVRLLRFRRASSRSNESFSSVRVQIWHEEGTSAATSRRGTQASDGASFVTAGTAVSGPLRERRVPNLSRLIVFLGRLDEYITVFVTDDIEAVPEGQTMVKIRPRKGGKLKRSVSRWPGVKGHLEAKKGSEPAGFNIDGQKTDPDVIYSFDLYESFDIEFESSPSQDNFVRKWDEVIKDRRLQRIQLDQIDEGMKTKTFTSKDAREIW
ncbi:hypothetical protein CONLIGDRAFT_677548 [Coniochaeta ligniaria NRRL 30616]|uniref:Uncharacterized protein n=1 Tax=Coniochaeta ligniaria NRRL 30616 TaxID=1408157 RepID=A0A1J7JKA1_9PEZI|nr:hypothetical protein CONLIGDRAFT_677548 [Coniochaeta ligniaria NRRL 30616]